MLSPAVQLEMLGHCSWASRVMLEDLCALYSWPLFGKCLGRHSARKNLTARQITIFIRLESSKIGKIKGSNANGELCSRPVRVS